MRRPRPAVGLEFGINILVKPVAVGPEKRIEVEENYDGDPARGLRKGGIGRKRAGQQKQKQEGSLENKTAAALTAAAAFSLQSFRPRALLW